MLGAQQSTAGKMRARAGKKRRMSKLAGSMEGEKILKTERLLFEPLLPKHAPLLHGALADERLYRFIPTDAPESVGALRTRYRKLASRRFPDGSEAWLNFAVRLRQDGSRAGTSYVGTLEATVYPDRSARVAYTVFVPFWDRG